MVGVSGVGRRNKRTGVDQERYRPKPPASSSSALSPRSFSDAIMPTKLRTVSSGSNRSAVTLERRR